MDSLTTLTNHDDIASPTTLGTNKRLLLIEPPFFKLYKNTYSLTRYPLSLGYLAAVVKERTDWRVRVFNADFTPQAESISFSYLTGEGFVRYKSLLRDLTAPIWKAIRERIAEYRPDVVGITAKSQNYASALNVATLVKEINPETLVVFGGPHPTLAGAEVLESGVCDFIIPREGEEVFIELLAVLDQNKDTINSEQFCTIQGLFFLENDSPVFTGSRDYIKELDLLPFPHEYAPEVLWDYEQFPDYAFRSIMATRGCPYNCLFCGSRNVWSRRVRFRSESSVVNQINSLVKSGIKRIHFEDDTFGVSHRYLRSLCNSIRTKCNGVEWSCEIHVKLINADNLRLMRDSGCISIQLGVESGSNRVLEDMRKQYTIEEAFRAANLIKKYRIELEAFFMVGFVTDDETSLRETWQAMKSVPGMVSYSIFTPYPGTEAFELCKAIGLIDNNFDVALYNHQSPENCFTNRIERTRFRQIVGTIEQKIDKKNRLQWLRDKFSFKTLLRLRRLGLKAIAKRVLQIFR